MVNVLELRKKLADAINMSEKLEPCVLPMYIPLPLSTVQTLIDLLDNILSDDTVIVTRCKDCGHKHRDGTCLVHKRPTNPNEFCNFGVNPTFLRQELSHD